MSTGTAPAARHTKCGASRISVRLDAKKAALLQGLCQEVGCDVSEMVRLALDRFAVTGLRRIMRSGWQASSAQSDSPPVVAPSCNSGISSAPPPLPIASGDPRQTSKPLQVAAASYPPKILALLPNYRVFGETLWGERRVLFQRLMAAAEVICESSDNPDDAKLRNKIMQLGTEFNQL